MLFRLKTDLICAAKNLLWVPWFYFYEDAIEGGIDRGHYVNAEQIKTRETKNPRLTLLFWDALPFFLQILVELL